MSTGRQAYAPGRVKTPSVFQMEVTECGAAALAIVLGYHGRFVPLETLRVECGVSRDGSQAVNILKAARRNGMLAKGVKVEEIDTVCKIDLPCVLFWEFDHFVVFEGKKGNKFYINDPATGPRSVCFDDFNRSFTGIVLVLEPGPDFRKQGSQPSLIAPLKERLEGSATSLLFVVLATLALTIPGVMTAGLSKVFIDSVLIQGAEHWVVWLIIGLFLTALLRASLTWLQQTVVMRFRTKISLTHSAKFFWHVLHLPMSFFYQRYAGDIGERIEANERIAQLLSNELAASVVGLLAAAFYSIVMALLNWQIATLAIAVAFCNAIVFYLVARAIADKSRFLLQQQGQLAGIEANGIQAIETLKATASENGFFARWAGHHAKTINSQQQIEYYNIVLEVISHLLTGLSTVAIFGYGGFLIMRGEMSVGTLVALQSLLVNFLAPITTLLGLGQETQEIRGDLMRLKDGLSQPLDPHLTSQLVSKAARCDSLESVSFLSVSFGYSPVDPPVVEDISFSLSPGKRIALVGATGSGKSTIAKLVCRFYSPWSGRILFGDKPIGEIRADDLARSLAFVDQDVFLFEGTVADNLTLWSPDVSGDRVQRAVADACIDTVIDARGGLLCHVEEGGANFSGGERQRLEIARALVGDPLVLILDEATASLDPLLELEIYQNIKRRNCAVLIIAHRLSAIRDCDEIILMEHGWISDRGTHEQLLSTSETYQGLYRLESRRNAN